MQKSTFVIVLLLLSSVNSEVQEEDVKQLIEKLKHWRKQGGSDLPMGIDQTRKEYEAFAKLYGREFADEVFCKRRDRYWCAVTKTCSSVPC